MPKSPKIALTIFESGLGTFITRTFISKAPLSQSALIPVESTGDKPGAHQREDDP